MEGGYLMKMVNEKIYIGSSMVYELLASMFRLECHEQMLPQDQQKLKYVSEDLTKWVVKSRSKLTDNMKKDMQRKGFEACKSILPFTRYVNERCDIGMDDWMKNHLSDDDFKAWIDAGKTKTESH